MTYEVYRYIFLGTLIGCGVMAVISGVLFFVLQIPRVIGDLTGHTARKAIEDIRRQNEQSGDKAYKSSTVNLKRGKLTDKITHSGRLVSREETPFGAGDSTVELPQRQEAEETTVLSADRNMTAPEETTVLPSPVMGSGFTVEYEITFLHSDEVIT